MATHTLTSPDPVGTRPSTARIVVLAALALVAVIAWVVCGSVFFAATQLRPIADDYCSAYYVSAWGYSGSVVHQYLVWQGDLLLLSLNHLLVGAPLAYLPFSLASLIPFAVTALGVVGLVVALVWPHRNAVRRLSAVAALAVVVPVGLIVWWGYWWVPVSQDPSHALYAQQAPMNQTYPWQIASGVLEWQTVSVAYILGPSLVIILWLIAEAVKRPRLRLVLFAVAGLLAGFGGLVFGLSAIAAVPVIAALRMLVARRFDRRMALETVGFEVLALIGWAAAYFSPGAQTRGVLMQAIRPLENPTLVSLFGWIFPTSIFTWTQALVNGGTLVALVVATGAGIVFASLKVRFDRRRLVVSAAALVAFALVTCIVARAGDAFSYGAFYHDVLPKAVIFPAAVLVGLALGSWIASATPPIAGTAGIVIAAVGFVVAISSLIPMTGNIAERYTAWQAGTAPSSGEDLGSQWVQQCWTAWGDTKVRELPAR